MKKGNPVFFAARLIWARHILRYLFCTLLVLIVIPSGSVIPSILHVFACGLLITAVLAAIVAEENPAIRGPYRIATGVALLVGLWIVFQASPLSAMFANPIWADASRLYGATAQSISVAPGDSLEGLIAALLPFFVFMTTLLLFRSDEQAFSLVRTMVLAGVVICAIGLVQHLLFPDMLLFAVKKYYLDSLTAVFVNRNTAATYIAMVMIFSAGLAFYYVQNDGLRSFLRFFINAPSQTRRPDAVFGLLYGLASATAFLALMLTHSRAGIASAIIGLLLMTAILSYSGSLQGTRRRHRFAVRRTSGWIKLGRAGLTIAVILIVGLLFARQAVFRAAVQGTEDLRFCFFPSLVAMTKDNWLLGTGFTTFADVFPAYRNPACGLHGVLNLAHNFYLEGWITLGLPFVVAAVIVIPSLLFYLISGIRNRRQYRCIPAAGLGVLVLQLAHNGVDFSIQTPGVAAVFAALMGATVVVSRGRTAKSEVRRAEDSVGLSESTA